MKYENIIDIATRYIPKDLKDDAKQAGYLGLLSGLKSSSIHTNKFGYLYRCARNEIISEMGRLFKPFALNPTTYNELIKYKKLKRLNTLGGFTKTSIEELELLLLIKQRSYNEL